MDDEPIDETVRIADEGAARRLTLVVIGDGIWLSQALPTTGHVVLGRAAEADIQIDHVSVSRRHAVLWLEPELAIEDTGSANGTRVRDEQLATGQRAPIALGEVIDLGSVVLTVQRRLAPTRPRRLWTRAYLQARVEEECARGARTGRPFVLATIQGEGVHDTAMSTLRPGDLVAAYGPRDLELLFPETPVDEARAIIDRIAAGVDPGGEPARARIGIAVFPRDGRTPEMLVEVAYRRARGDDNVGEREAVAAPQLERLVEKVAGSDISVLLLGETGVGKEVTAARIHALSPRRDQPFVALDCAALSETLLESELFGHARGAFTGADVAKPGLFEAADGGTVLLDEVGEMPAAVQAKLLRVLQERQVRRLGELTPRAIDVRIISATNRDLEEEIARGAFRADLFYRLAGITLTLPPLRERVTEIEPLARRFIAEACARSGMVPPELEPGAIIALEGHSWPGNIRELRNVIDRALVLSSGPTIRGDDLPLQAAPAPASRRLQPDGLSLDETGERARILDALEKTGGNQSSAAELLGITRRVLMRRLDRYRIARPRKR